MSKKIMLLALAVVSAAMFAVPAVAAAGEWTLDNATGKTFTIAKNTNPVLRSANGDTITCTGLTGSGSYTTNTTGTVSLDFTGCTENTFGFSCQSGTTSGTIAVSSKTFHNVIIGSAGAPDNSTPIGILVTGGTSFTTFSCASLFTATVTGNVIGEVENPNCNVAGTSYALNFAPATAGGTVQKYKQITTTGSEFKLFTDIFGGTFESSQEGTGTITMSGPVTATCS